MAETIAQRRAALKPMLEEAIAVAGDRCRRLVTDHPDYYPMYTVAGRWGREAETWTRWCEGFYPGIFWLLHKQTREPQWRQLAERYSRPLEPRRHDRTVHDLGFLFFS